MVSPTSKRMMWRVTEAPWKCCRDLSAVLLRRSAGFEVWCPHNTWSPFCKFTMWYLLDKCKYCIWRKGKCHALPHKFDIPTKRCNQKHSTAKVYNGYNGYNGRWPSARLFGWSAADWSRPATNKSISSERKREGLLFCWGRKSWTSWLLMS